MPLILAPGATLATAAATTAAMKGLDFTGSLISRAARGVASGNPIKSLADLAKPARVEPLMIVDRELADQPYMEDIAKMALSTFTGYYMQAASMMINVNRIETLRVLDSLNPVRTFDSDIRRKMVDAVWSKEAFKDGLPSLEAYANKDDQNVLVSIEAATEESGLKSARIDDESVKKLYEVESMAVGKVVNVEFKEDNETVKVPVLIRMVPTTVPSQVLTHIFTATNKNSSWRERYHLWRAGQISLIRDLIFSADLIDQHRKALINDTSNVYMTISDRRRNNTIKAIGSDNPSMADASNIAVISKNTAKAIEREVYGKLSALKTRKQIFDSTYLILLIVVDDQWERVTVYHRGYDQPSEYSFKEIKSSEKGKGPDITEILKAYQLGSTPTI